MVTIDPDPKAHHAGQAALLMWSLVWCGAAVYMTLAANRNTELVPPVALSCVGIAMAVLARPRRARLGLRLLYLFALCLNLLVGGLLYLALYRIARM